MTATGARRGRPLDPDISEAALCATLELLDERGYAQLRVGDVAERAGIGLGALYRRWATKPELVVAALKAAAAQQHVRASADPLVDLVDGLVAIAAGLSGRGGRLLAVLFGPAEPELVAAIRSAKVIPLREANRERLRRIIGDTPELAARADLGPGLIVLHFLADGRQLSRRQIENEVVPLMIGTTRSAR